MNEEEKEAINYLKDFRNNVYNGVGTGSVMAKNIDIIFTIIEKRQKEIEKQQKENEKLKKQLKEERAFNKSAIKNSLNAKILFTDGEIKELKEIVFSEFLGE